MTVAGRPVIVPTLAQLHWKPNWKADLFADLGVGEHGLIDIGANRGQSLLDFVAAGGRRDYVAFEPLPEEAAIVREVILLNDLADSLVVPVGLGATHAVQQLYIPDDDSTSGTVRPGLRPGRPEERRAVGIHPFDHVWSAIGQKSSPQVVKVDVEGGELEVLRGMTSYIATVRPTLVCEVLDADPRADPVEHDRHLGELESLLAQADYQIERIIKPEGRLVDRAVLSRFPRRKWTTATAEECDYRLSPR